MDLVNTNKYKIEKLIKDKKNEWIYNQQEINIKRNQLEYLELKQKQLEIEQNQLLNELMNFISKPYNTTEYGKRPLFDFFLFPL
jgi:hypothetical protein